VFDISLFPFHRNAAAVMLSGQVADGFATILVGELVFKPHFPLCSKEIFPMLLSLNITFVWPSFFFWLIFSPCVAVSLGVGECIALACVITE